MSQHKKRPEEGREEKAMGESRVKKKVMTKEELIEAKTLEIWTQQVQLLSPVLSEGQRALPTVLWASPAFLIALARVHCNSYLWTFQCLQSPSQIDSLPMAL